ncbi:MAG: PHB depolymerase family esterase [bacterium]
MRLIAATLLLFAASADAGVLPSAGCANAEIAHGRRLEQTLTVDGAPRQVILDVPDAVQAKTPVPLLLDFHGFGHSGAGVWQVSGFKQLAAEQGFITAYPEGLPVTLTIRGEPRTGPGWKIDAIDGNRDVAFVTALLDDLERRYCIDRSRLYSTGFSNGAFFSQLLACAQSARIAAVAAISGTLPRIECHPSRAVPILMQHGSEDDVVPVAWARAARDAWLTIDGCPADTKAADGPSCERWTCRAGAMVEYCEEAYAHTWPAPATERVWTFLSHNSLP